MTEKQKIFADEYLIDLNATRAYKVGKGQTTRLSLNPFLVHT